MTSRLGMIAFLAGALFAQVYALQADLERERRLRERDARDSVQVMDRARDELAAAGQLADAHASLLAGVRELRDEVDPPVAERLDELLPNQPE